MPRAKPIPASSLNGTIDRVLEACASRCLDDADDRRAVAALLVDALLQRPEAVALRAIWGSAGSQCGLLAVQREIGGWLEGETLSAAARLSGLQVTR